MTVLLSMISYNEKHNEKNGWNNTDGANDNNSWNCGAEGETKDPAILDLRHQMMRNAFAVLMCSRGIPMFLAGDEFGNTQFGNNNAYCQDNITSWLDWGQLEKNRDIFEFFKYMISFRKEHRVLRANISDGACGFPDVSFHGEKPWRGNFARHERYVGVLFAGEDENGMADIVYVASNAYWESIEVLLPALPERMHWELVTDTWEKALFSPRREKDSFRIQPRSVRVLVARKG